LLDASSSEGKVLKQQLDRELTAAGVAVMTRAAFYRLFPKSKIILRHIFTLTKAFIFDHPSYKWSGVLDDLDKDDAVLFNLCADQAVSRFLRIGIRRRNLFPGIAEFSTHICLWAVEKHLHETSKFRKRARQWVQAALG
jgi:hypothetical protein